MTVTRTVIGAAGKAVRTSRTMVRTTVKSGRWLTRRVRRARDRSAAGEVGMTRLLDLHAASCAGDTLVTIGLAGTIFFSVPAGEARGKVAIYLLVTMVPFALLAPVVGPLLDHFRHGRRFALAATMLGRAFLAWMISDYQGGFGLYPAAFGVLALSRAYGVARSAAVPRLLPARLGLSEAGARASVYGTVAGLIVAPLGVLAFRIGPQWPPRLAAIVFFIGMTVALRLPPRADSDPPETMPRVLQVLRRAANREKVLSGRLVIATLAGSAGLRALYGFLLLFLAFAIKAGDLDTRFFDTTLSPAAALGVVGGMLAAGTFLSTAIGTRLRIRRPVALQAGVLVIAALLALLATVQFSLLTISLLCLVTAIGSGLAKLAVDASIQEKIPERVRASAFAHSETLLMLAWVAGGALGLIPFHGRLGVGIAAIAMVVAALRAVFVALRLRRETLRGKATPVEPAARAAPPASPTPPRPTPSPPARSTPPPPPPAAEETLAPPGFHIYRPSTADSGSSSADPKRGS